jgi:hypothetical protein
MFCLFCHVLKFAHKIVHLTGRPHGPSLPFGGMLAVLLLPLTSGFDIISVSPPIVPSLGPSSQAKLTFDTVRPNCSP